MDEIKRLNLKKLSPQEQETYKALIKPAYTPLISGTKLWDPQNKDQMAFAAIESHQPVALLIAERNRQDQYVEIRSFFVSPQAKDQKLGIKLLDTVKKAAHVHKDLMLLATYPNEPHYIETWEKPLIAAGWEGKKLILLECYFADCQHFHPPWFDKKYSFPEGYEVFPWSELTPEESQDIKERLEHGSIPRHGNPYQGDGSFEPITSLGLRHNGKVIAWMINRAINPDLLCYFCLYSDYDYQKKGYAILLLIESVKRQQQLSPFKQGILQVSYKDATLNWIQFVQRRAGPYTTKYTEYWQAWCKV